MYVGLGVCAGVGSGGSGGGGGVTYGTVNVRLKLFAARHAFLYERDRLDRRGTR